MIGELIYRLCRNTSESENESVEPLISGSSYLAQKDIQRTPSQMYPQNKLRIMQKVWPQVRREFVRAFTTACVLIQRSLNDQDPFCTTLVHKYNVRAIAFHVFVSLDGRIRHELHLFRALALEP